MNTLAASRFSATIEFLPGQRAAIIELTDARGEWSGGQRIDIRSSLRSDLYEEGYRAACRAAAVKGGTLDRFSEYGSPSPSSSRCAQLVTPALARRPANALNIEIGAPLARCLRKLPRHWSGKGASALRWIGSGGSPLVFGICTPGKCPR